MENNQLVDVQGYQTENNKILDTTYYFCSDREKDGPKSYYERIGCGCAREGRYSQLESGDVCKK